MYSLEEFLKTRQLLIKQSNTVAGDVSVLRTKIVAVEKQTQTVQR